MHETLPLPTVPRPIKANILINSQPRAPAPTKNDELLKDALTN